METILIDEKELRDKFVKKARATNTILRDALINKESEYGIKGESYVGGLTRILCNEKSSLEDNIDNLIDVFHNNYLESIFFQLENMRKRNTLDIVLHYLKSRGLEEDFAQFRSRLKQTPLNTKQVIPIQENMELSDK